MRRAQEAALLVAAAGVALAGCGGNGDNGVAELTAEEILAEAKEAATDAESVRISGEVAGDGEEFGIDMGYSAEDAAGTFSFNGVDIEIISVNGDIYMRADADAWTTMAGDPAAGQLFADRYVLIPPDDPNFGDIAGVADLDSLLDETLTVGGTITKGEETEIDGQEVIAVLDDEGTTLYVATTGDPLPIQITTPEGESVSLEFDWDATVEVMAPDEADVIDLSELR